MGRSSCQYRPVEPHFSLNMCYFSIQRRLCRCSCHTTSSADFHIARCQPILVTRASDGRECCFIHSLTSMPNFRVYDAMVGHPEPHLVRARPKSQILRSQDALSSRLLGFRSRCSTFAVCTYLRPRRICMPGAIQRLAAAAMPAQRFYGQQHCMQQGSTQQCPICT